MKKTNSNIQDLCMIGLFTAVIVIMAQIVIPMPLGVPMTMQTFAITLVGMILGSKNGASSSLIYILLGAIGLPVFANFTGGWQSFFGPTGGFILSFPLMAYLIGLGIELRGKWKGYPVLFLTLGTSINFLCGMLMFCGLTQSSFSTGFAICVLPFIPTAGIKAFLAYILGINIRRRL